MHIHFIQHAAFEYPGSILDWTIQKNYSYSFTKVYEAALFPTTAAFDVLIIMGGPMGVYETDTYDWIEKEKSFIQLAIAAGKKVLGVCLGAQFIAAALGSKVYPHTVKEIGWWPLQQTAVHPLTQHLPQSFTSFHWHGDTFDLPVDARLLLSSAACVNQGFVYGNHVLGLQFHMEVKADLLENMTDHERLELVKADFVQTEEEIKASSNKYLLQNREWMYGFLDAFIG